MFLIKKIILVMNNQSTMNIIYICVGWSWSAGMENILLSIYQLDEVEIKELQLILIRKTKVYAILYLIMVLN